LRFRLPPESRLAPVLFRVRSIVIPFARSSRYVTVEYWAEDPLRLYLNANGSGNIALRAGLNHGKQPAFILKGNAQTKSPRRPVVAARANIGQGAAAGNKLLADLLMAEIDLHVVPRAKPIVCPGLRALPVAADPASDQRGVIGVAAAESVVEIEEAVTDGTACRDVRVHTFHAQIQSRKLGQMREIQAPADGRPIPIHDGTGLVFGKS